MNLGGAVLGGMVQQANTEQELGVKRGNLALQMQQLAGQRLAATYDQAQQIVSQLPSDADRPSVQQTLGALKQDAMALAHGAGMNPQTAGMRFDALITTTPTIQTAAQQKGGASSTSDAASAPGAALKAGLVGGATELAKAPYTPVVIPPGASAVPATAVLPATQGAPLAAPTPGPGGAAALAGNATANPGAPPGVVPNAGGGLTNTTSPAMVNLNQGQTPSFLEQTGKDVAAYITSKQTAIPAISQSLKAIDDLKGSLDKLPTGPGTDLATGASAVLSRFGVDINKVLPANWQTDPTKYSVAVKNINQLAAAWARAEFPSRITDSDMRIAFAANPSIDWNNPKANSQLLDSLESVQRIKLEEAKFMRGEGAKFGSDNPPNWMILDRWTDHLAAMKGVPDDVKRSYMAYSDMAANPQVGTSPQITIPPGTVPSGVGGPSLAAPPAAGGSLIDPNDALRELRRRGRIK